MKRSNWCPPGTAWNGSACAGQVVCAAGTTWDGKQCIRAAECEAGSSWDGITCVRKAVVKCPTDSMWDGSECIPVRADWLVTMETQLLGGLHLGDPLLKVLKAIGRDGGYTEDAWWKVLPKAGEFSANDVRYLYVALDGAADVAQQLVSSGCRTRASSVVWMFEAKHLTRVSVRLSRSPGCDVSQWALVMAKHLGIEAMVVWFPDGYVGIGGLTRGGRDVAQITNLKDAAALELRFRDGPWSDSERGPMWLKSLREMELRASGAVPPAGDSSQDAAAKADVGRALAGHDVQIRACYVAALRNKPETAGKVRVSFMVDTTGTVIPATIVVSGTTGEFADCIRNKFMTVRGLPLLPTARVFTQSFVFSKN